MNHAILDVLINGTNDVSAADRMRTQLGAGAAANSTTISAKESVGLLNKTTITLTDFAVTVANTSGASFGGAKFYDFPAGAILLVGAIADLDFDWSDTDIGATGSGDWSIGTGITADATLTATDTDIIPQSAMTDPFVGGVGRGVGQSRSAIASLTDSSAGTADGTIEACADLSTSNTYTDAAVNAKLAILRNWAADFSAKINALIANNGASRVLVGDGTTTAKDANLNIIIDDADVEDGASDVVLVSGEITLYWVNLGDYTAL